MPRRAMGAGKAMVPEKARGAEKAMGAGRGSQGPSRPQVPFGSGKSEKTMELHQHVASNCVDFYSNQTTHTQLLDQRTPPTTCNYTEMITKALRVKQIKHCRHCHDAGQGELPLTGHSCPYKQRSKVSKAPDVMRSPLSTLGNGPKTQSDGLPPPRSPPHLDHVHSIPLVMPDVCLSPAHVFETQGAQMSTKAAPPAQIHPSYTPPCMSAPFPSLPIPNIDPTLISTDTGTLSPNSSDFYVLSAIRNHPAVPPPFQVLAPHRHAIPQSLSPSSVAPPNTQKIVEDIHIHSDSTKSQRGTTLPDGRDLGESMIVGPLNPSVKDGQSVSVGAGELLLPPESSAQGSMSREFSVISEIIGSPAVTTGSRHSSVLPHCTPAPPTANTGNPQLHSRTPQLPAAPSADDGKQKHTADEDGEIQATDVGLALKKRKGFTDRKVNFILNDRDRTNAYYKRAGTIISKCRELTEATGAYVVTIIACPETLGQGNSKFLVSDNLKIDQDTVEDIKTSMEHLGTIFLQVQDAGRSGSLQQIAEQWERADQAEREREIARKEKEEVEVSLMQEQELCKELERKIELLCSK
ncbi:hypothetical protein BU17DRAFT_90500 [Hysterangium stoloniferum]|nr:hypothetical protein BU17DRAFT_90500 [Hysterangium stoloniferum]